MGFAVRDLSVLEVHRDSLGYATSIAAHRKSMQTAQLSVAELWMPESHQQTTLVQT